MKKRYVFGLLILWTFVVLYKYPIWLHYREEIEKICGCEIDPFFNESIFGWFIFPFSLSLLFLFCIIKFGKQYGTIAKRSILFLSSLALFFSFHGIFINSRLLDDFPKLGGLFAIGTFIEGLFSISLILLFVNLFLFAFGKKDVATKDSGILASGFLIFFVLMFICLLPMFIQRYTIPENSDCVEVSYNEFQESELGANDFKIKGGNGVYKYYMKFEPKEKGHLFLKAYEINTNDKLSEYSINYVTTKVEDVSQTFYTGTFKISEEVGIEYCARIEIWYKPNNGKEYKVNQGKFVIQGYDG